MAAVEAVEFVSVLAVRLLRVDVCSRCGVALRIFRASQRVEMLRIDATATTADVIDDMAFWDRPTRDPHGDAMGFACSASHKDHAISVFVGFTSPNDAVSMRRTLGLKAIYFGLGGTFHGSYSFLRGDCGVAG